MKKSNLLIILLLAFTLVFVGCSSDEESDTNENGQIDQSEDMGSEDTGSEDVGEDVEESRLSESFARIMRGEEYTIKYRSEMEIDGKTESFDTTMAISGDDSVIESESPSMNMHTVFIQKDDMTYLVNHAEETVIKMPYGEEAEEYEDNGMDQSVDLETDDMVFSTSGSGEFKGNTYDYEEYGVEGGYIRYYFDGKDLVGMEIKSGEDIMTWEVLELSEDVDESLFEIPEGYQTIDMGMGME